MKKKTYITPKMKAVALRGPRLMLGGSDNVRNYKRGDKYNINIGDED